MPQHPDVIREFGIIPDRVSAPQGVVRASFSTGTVVGQYIGTIVVLTLGLGMSTVLLFVPFPINLLVAPVPVLMAVMLAYLVGRHDYRWIELEGETLRAKHLYTGKIVERSIRDIDHLLTLVFQVQNLTTMIANAWLGRVRGFKIHFRDGRTPLLVSRVDPKMKNAQELMEAIVYRMSQAGEIDAEVVTFQGSPLVRRIFWKK